MNVRKTGLIIAGILILLFVVPIYVHFNRLSAESIESKADRGKDINILLMGSDARPDEINARSDTIILVSIHPSFQKAVLVWIPRDTRLYAPVKGFYKINSVNFVKGPEATCEVASNMMGVDVDHYVLVNFSGFEKMIDMLGGIDMDVDIRLYSARSNVYLEKGYQHLNGREALKYARFRNQPSADIGRTQRQQRLMKALTEKVLEPSTLVKLPRLVPELQENVVTNISFNDILFLTKLCFLYDSTNIQSQTLPGYHWIDPNSGASYWEVDREIARSLIRSVLNGHQYEVLIEH
ncbi:MAG: LCP family protein [Bacillota bacterium]|nr:LCP family protein [Bacillota bacterium]